MRAHYYRTLQDTQGNLVPGCTVRVLQPGTTTLIQEALYADDSTSTTLPNPFVSDDGLINFYLEEPARVRIGVTAIDTPEVFFESVDVLSISDSTDVPTHEHGDPSHAFTVRIGPGASTNEEGAVAIGSGSSAGNHSTAVGEDASAPHLGAAAFGNEAITDEDDQVKVGGPHSYAEFPNHIVLPSSSGARYQLLVDDSDPANLRLAITSLPSFGGA